MSEVERLKQRLQDMGVKQFRPFWGPEAHKLTEEERAVEIHRVLDQIESGNCKPIYDVDHGLEFDSQEQCWEFYDKYPEPRWSEWTGVAYQEEYKAWEAKLPERHKAFMDEKHK